VEGGERLLLVWIETRRVGGDRGEQHTAASRRVRRAGGGAAEKRTVIADGREDNERAMTPHNLSPPPGARSRLRAEVKQEECRGESRYQPAKR